MSLATASVWLTHIFFVLCWSVVISHHLLSIKEKSPWWRTSWGWHVMSLSLGLATVFSFVEIAHWIPALVAHSWYLWWYLASLSVVAGVIGWREGIILYHLFRKRDKE